MKNIEIIEPTITIKSAIKEENIEELDKLAEKLKA